LARAKALFTYNHRAGRNLPALWSNVEWQPGIYPYRQEGGESAKLTTGIMGNIFI